jgi:hypothetical protein
MRRIAALVAAFTALVFFAPAADAGTGESGYCFDGGWTDVPILTTPVTLGVETHVDSGRAWIAVCYATSPLGFGGAQVTGGLAKIYVGTDGSGFVQCRPDANPYVLELACGASFTFQPAGPGGISLLFDASAGAVNTPLVTLGTTGLVINQLLAIGPGVTVTPTYPCIYVGGVQVVPGCGTPIV